MFETVEEAVTWLHQRRNFNGRPGLIRVARLLAMLGNPERRLRAIHVAGTNGKGSVTAYLRNILAETGLTVGSFTSPFIETFNERIAVDSQPIKDADLLEELKRVQPFVEELDRQPDLSGITEFEILTAAAFDYFARINVDAAVIEVGIGGLLDSTNVLTPLVSVITTVGMDHMDLLGDTLEKIAAQKAGIIKNGIPIVAGKLPEAARTVIEETAEKAAAPLYEFGRDFSAESGTLDGELFENFSFSDRAVRWPHLRTPLIGKHQAENAAVALEAARLFAEELGLSITRNDIKKGLDETRWPGRMEIISAEPLIMLDGAHNAPAAQRLAENLRKEFSGRQLFLIIGSLVTKDLAAILAPLAKLSEVKIYLTPFQYSRARSAADLAAFAGGKIQVVSAWQEGLADALANLNETDDLILFTGSLYFISEVRAALLEGEKNEI